MSASFQANANWVSGKVKASLIYNHIVKKMSLANIPVIQDGDKIKFVYLKTPNPLHESVFACLDELPDELYNIDKYIDRDMQFQKSFLAPLVAIADVIGWATEPRSTLEGFFDD